MEKNTDFLNIDYFITLLITKICGVMLYLSGVQHLLDLRKYGHQNALSPGSEMPGLNDAEAADSGIHQVDTPTDEKDRWIARHARCRRTTRRPLVDQL